MLEFGPGTIHASFPASVGLGVGEQSYSNCLAFAVEPEAQLMTLALWVIPQGSEYINNTSFGA